MEIAVSGLGIFVVENLQLLVTMTSAPPTMPQQQHCPSSTSGSPNVPSRLSSSPPMASSNAVLIRSTRRCDRCAARDWVVVATDELLRFVVTQFVENRCGPQRPIQTPPQPARAGSRAAGWATAPRCPTTRRTLWMGQRVPGLGSPPLGDDSARLTQPLANDFRIVVSVDVDRCGRQRLVLAIAALLAIGENVVEQQSMAIADPLSRQRTVGDQADHRRAAHSQQVCSLLGGQLHRMRRDGDGLAGMQRRNNLVKAWCTERGNSMRSCSPIPTRA